MSTHTRCQLFFPAVKVGQYPDLIAIEATSYRQQEYDRWCSFGKQAAAHKNHLKPLLENSRLKEPPATRHQDIAIDFLDLQSRDLGNRSYDLAVLLADKIARLHPAPDKLPHIIATGEVQDDLRVAWVSSFADKVKHLQTALASGKIPQNSLFCYPQANHAEAEAALKQLEKAGMQVRPVQHLRELEDLWTGKPVSVPTERHWLRNLFISIVLFLALLWALAETCLLPVPHCELPVGECKALNCASDFIDPAAFKLQYSYRSKADGYADSHRLQDQQVLHTGDQFKLAFQVPVDAYVYVYYLDSGNQLLELFDIFDIPHLVTRQQHYVLPNETASFTLSGQAGIEQVYFIARKTPETQLFRQYQQLQQAGNTAQAAQRQTQLLQRLQTHRSLTIQHQP